MDSRKSTLESTMTTTPLIIPISLILSDTGLILVYEDDRVEYTPEKNTASLTLLEEENETVIFEIADFMANGNTYRVNARYATSDMDWTRWQRLSTGCRSPAFAHDVEFTLEITATPATRWATTASTTSTTVITKKGRPEELPR